MIASTNDDLGEYEELTAEDERPAELLVVDAARLRHAVHEHVEGSLDMTRQLDLAAVFRLTP